MYMHRLPVAYAYCGDQVEPQEREVCDIVLVEGLIVEVGMDQPQSSEGTLAEGIVLQRGNKDAFCITDNDMGDGPFPVC